MSIAVVPIFMSAGAAVLPTVIVAVTGVAAIVFKPRELLRVARARPGAALAIAAGVVLMVAGVTYYLMRTPRLAVRAAASATGDARAASHADWSQVALDILAQQAAGKTPTVLAVPSASAQPLVAGHDFTRASYAGGPSPEKLHPLWTYHPKGTLFLAAPLVAGNRVFVAACLSDLGGYTGLLACVDADTGKALWEVTSMDDDNLKPFFSSPALTADGKYLIVGQGLHQDTDCKLMCYDAVTGDLRWAVKTPLHIESSPAIFGDMAIVGAGAIEGPGGLPTGNPGYVFAVHISDGKELWRQPVNDPESDPAIDAEGNVYIGSGFNGCAVVAMRSAMDEELKAKGLSRLLWKTPTDFPVTAPIALLDDMVVAGSGNGDVAHSAENPQGVVMALDRKTGAIRWQTKFEDSVLGAIALRNGLALCPVRSGRVTALGLKDGASAWQLHISGNSPVLAGCAVTDTRVYAVSSDGNMAVLSMDGKVLERIYLNDQAKPGTGLTVAPPQVSNGRVYVGSESGGLRCFAGTEAQP